MPTDKSLSDLWKRKDDYIASRLDWLSKRVDRSQQILLNDLVGGFMGEFSVDDTGKLIANTKNMRLAVKLDSFFDTLDEETLRKVNTQYGKDMLKLTPLSDRYYSKMLPDAADAIKSIGEKVGFIETSIGNKRRRYNQRWLSGEYYTYAGSQAGAKRLCYSVCEQ